MPPETPAEAFERWYKANEELFAATQANARYIAWCAWQAHEHWVTQVFQPLEPLPPAELLRYGVHHCDELV